MKEEPATKEITRKERLVALDLAAEHIEKLFVEKLVPVRKQHEEIMKNGTDEQKSRSWANFNKALDAFDRTKEQVWQQAALLYRDVMQGKTGWADRCPQGLKLVSQNIDLDTLRIYSFYPYERMVPGVATEPGKQLGAPDDRLLVEVRPSPEDYGYLYPAESYLVERLSGKGGMDTEQIQQLNYLFQHPDVTGGIMEMDLQDESRFLNTLYIEGVQMAKVKQVLLQQPDISQGQLQETLQLMRLQNEGVKVVEDRLTLTGKAKEAVDKVTEDYQHYYHGKQHDLFSHPDYEKHLRPKFDNALKSQAEFELRKMGVIPTLPESYRVRWSNNMDNNWECKQMTDIVNGMFKGYAGNIVKARQEDDWMQLDIYTTNPEYRRRILDTVNKSWACKEVKPVMLPEKMPVEIAEARRAEEARREASLQTSIVGFESVYFYEEGVPGYVRLDYDRKLSGSGEALTDKNMQYIKDLAREGNILHSGCAMFTPRGPERTFYDRVSDMVVHTREESVDGKKVLMSTRDLNVFDSDNTRYVEVTGRVEDVKTNFNGRDWMMRCKIDGVQQMGRKISAQDVDLLRYKPQRDVDVAIRRFADELVQSAQERDRGFKR